MSTAQKKLKTNWSIEAAQDLRSIHGIRMVIGDPIEVTINKKVFIIEPMISGWKATTEGEALFDGNSFLRETERGMFEILYNNKSPRKGWFQC